MLRTSVKANLSKFINKDITYDGWSGSTVVNGTGIFVGAYNIRRILENGAEPGRRQREMTLVLAQDHENVRRAAAFE